MTELKEIQETQAFIKAINKAFKEVQLTGKDFDNLLDVLKHLRQNYALCEYCGKELVQDENGSYICENYDHND